MSYLVTGLAIEQHKAALTELWRENFEEDEILDYIHERFAWIYEQCPQEFMRTWLAVDSESQAVVGCGSAYGADRYLRGRRLRGSVPVVFAVDRNHRIGAAALSIQRAIVAARCTGGDGVLVGRPNEQARPILVRIGYHSLGQLTNWVRDVDPQSSDDWNARALGYDEEILDVADSRFDDLWNRGRECFQEVIGERTSAFLNSRYSGFTQLPYRFYCLVRADDRRLVGYVIYRPWQEGFLMPDVFCESPDAETVDHLLRAFEATMRAQGALWLAVSYLGPRWFAECLERRQYSPAREQHDEVMIYANPTLDPAILRALKDPAQWCLFGGDTHIFI